MGIISVREPAVTFSILYLSAFLRGPKIPHSSQEMDSAIRVLFFSDGDPVVMTVAQKSLIYYHNVRGNTYFSLHCRKGHGYRKRTLECSVRFIISPEIVHTHMSLSSPCYGASGNGMCGTWKFGGFTTRQPKVRTCSTLLIFKF